MEYTVFSDESYSTGERFRSISAFSFPSKFELRFSESLTNILEVSCVEEFKWQKLRDAKHRFCALSLINFIFETLSKNNVRIDVLTWDIRDSRHNILGRDDISNFGRMFFHLMKNVLLRRENQSIWRIFPDEKLDVDWITIKDCLNSVGKWSHIVYSPKIDKLVTAENYTIDTFTEVESHEHPCIQIADLFAGLSVFSINKYDRYKNWWNYHYCTISLFEKVEEEEYSNSEINRFKVLNSFNTGCKKRTLGVSLDSFKRLCTLNPDNPINFWLYKPQHDFDTAPTRTN
jgi:hypothetical protein